MLWSRRLRLAIRAIWSVLSEIKEVGAFHAVPVTIGYMVEPYAVGVVGGIAAVAQKQNVLSFRRVADGTRIALLFFLFNQILAKPLLDIKLGDLFLLLDRICGYGGA